MKKICIVTTRHISYNPRVLKEADAFYRKGYAVSVVTLNNHAGQYAFDLELMQSRRWQLKTLNFRREVAGEKRYWLYLSLLQKGYALLGKATLAFGIAERLALKGFDALTKMAARENADFYLAHHAEALGVAYRAAKANGAGFGFDAEDFHSGMSEDGGVSKEDALAAFLEAKYLPHCTYFTAASKGIGEAYAEKYKLPVGRTILNVFPLERVESNGVHKPVRFYWYSQVIGPNRSLETLLEAASQIKRPFELHLRGSFHSDAYQKSLEGIVNEKGLQGKVFFYPPILAERIITDAAQFDVGLALESDVSVNRNICVTNKIFSYLMSGLAIVGTDTYGQRDIFEQFKQAVAICRQGDAADLANAMESLIAQPDKLAAAKKAARRAAEERFNWEAESVRLLAGFEETVNQKQEQPSLALQSN